MAKKIRKKKQGFNVEQMQVIGHNTGSCLVQAVAGAGKTTAIVHRISRLIKENIVKPHKILATTFTDKAAKEMNERLEKLGVNTEVMQVSTFHSLCYSIIKEEATNAPKMKLDNIQIDSDGSKSQGLIKFVVGYQNLNWKNADINEVEHFISTCKNSLIRPFEVDISTMQNGLLFKQAYELYEKYRTERKFITFDDMPIRAWEILDTNPQILRRWQRRFEYVIVDEFQDTNKAQYVIMSFLALPENNLMVVGDVDQSIYTWRGAIPGFMIDFQKNFNSEVILMEKNYRCAQSIGNLANPLISNNVKRLNQTLRPQREEIGEYYVNSYYDFQEESMGILQYIQNLPEFHNAEYNKIAILYRTNSQSRAIEEVFIENEIPYEVAGGGSFYDRKEIKDILAYIYAAYDINDKADESYMRILNIPYRYLNKQFTNDLMEYMERNKLSVEEALKDMPLSGNQKRNIDDLLDVIDTIKSMKKEKPEKILNWLISKIDYEKYLQEYGNSSSNDGSRFDNVLEFIKSSGKYRYLSEYIEYIHKLKMKSKKKKGQKNKVLLTTIHRAKGLEWENVLIIGINELILPHNRNMDGDKLEEERRLAYVAITRAKDRLFMSYVQVAAASGGIRELQPSRFLLEIPEIQQIIQG